jgi:uncharacterized protein YfiM (DUF2279 family)
LLILVSPMVAGLSAQSLVAHHFAHWLWVVAGAIVGYQFRDLVRLPGRTLVAWAGLGAAFAWHLPPLLSWAETDQAAHIFAHATLLVGGGAMGWAVPQLSGARKAALFIGANVVMWPLVLAELANAFVYPSYPGQATTAGIAELVAMPLAWLVLAFWGPLRAGLARPGATNAVQALFALAAVVGWVLPF